MNADFSLAGQVVLLNGAGRAPGPALAQALAAHGATIAACDVTPILLDPLVDSIHAQGGKITPYIADSSRGMPARAMVDEILSDLGDIHILINNPRVAPNTPLLEMDEWDWQHTLEVNLGGPFLMTKLVGRMMRDQGHGIILNILEAQSPALEAPGRTAYAASQMGLQALTRAVWQELIAYNIRIYAFCLENALLQASGGTNPTAPDEHYQALIDLALFTCSPAAANLSGQVFRIELPTALRPTTNITEE